MKKQENTVQGRFSEGSPDQTQKKRNVLALTLLDFGSRHHCCVLSPRYSDISTHLQPVSVPMPSRGTSSVLTNYEAGIHTANTARGCVHAMNGNGHAGKKQHANQPLFPIVFSLAETRQGTSKKVWVRGEKNTMSALAFHPSSP